MPILNKMYKNGYILEDFSKSTFIPILEEKSAMTTTDWWVLCLMHSNFYLSL